MKPPRVPDADSGLERVHAGKDQAYRAVLADFDASIQAAPEDGALAVSRCRFIGQFTDDEYDSIEAAPADFDACRKALEKHWPRDPNVQLFNLDQLWGEEAATLGEKLLLEDAAWPAALRRHLLTKVSVAYENEDDDGPRAGELAVEAAELGETSRVAAAVAHLVDAGKPAQAQALLHNAPAASVGWQASRRVEAALVLPDPAAALAELRRYDDSGVEVEAVIAARAYLRAGDIAAAQKLLEGKSAATAAIKEVRFDAAMAAGDMKAAAAEVSIGDSGSFPGAAQRFAMVATQSPATLLGSGMLLMLFVLALLIVLMALAPGLVLLPVHYRGMMRRMRGKIAVPLFDGINLRYAWFGAAVAICIPMIVAGVVAPGSVATLLGGESLPDNQALLRMTAWGTLVGLLVLLPGMRALGWRAYIGDRNAWRHWWRVLVAWAIVIAVGIAINAWNKGAGDTSTTQTKMVETLMGGSFQQYGLGITLLLIAVLVPMFEELVFRGLLLGGMTSHIGFGWANLIQAVLFAVVHGDSPRFLFYLTLGLLSGWLAKKSRSLGPSIALHGLNNALATLIRFSGAG